MECLNIFSLNPESRDNKSAESYYGMFTKNMKKEHFEEFPLNLENRDKDLREELFSCSLLVISRTIFWLWQVWWDCKAIQAPPAQCGHNFGMAPRNCQNAGKYHITVLESWHVFLKTSCIHSLTETLEWSIVLWLVNHSKSLNGQ